MEGEVLRTTAVTHYQEPAKSKTQGGSSGARSAP
jgi:hypothetical protein